LTAGWHTPAQGARSGMRLQHLVGSGLRLAQRVVNARALIFGTYEPDITEIVDKVRPYTMTSVARVAALCDAMSHIVRHEIPGAFVECGVWKGGSSMAAALRLLQLGRANRPFHLFDTFEGMTLPTEIDRSATSGFSAAAMLKSAPIDSKLAAYASIEEVRRNMAATGYPPELIHLVRGPVEMT